MYLLKIHYKSVVFIHYENVLIGGEQLQTTGFCSALSGIIVVTYLLRYEACPIPCHSKKNLPIKSLCTTNKNFEDLF